jgi:tricorn protease
VGWGVENYGTDPTVEVDNAPQDAAAGRDRQLEAALAEATKLIGRKGGVKPNFGKRPNLARQRLPARRRP